MEQQDELKETFLELYSSAIFLEEQKKQKSAVILMSKALFALLDYIILKEYKKLPKNHTERFRILELKTPNLYRIVDRVWSKYTDTYRRPASEEAFLLLQKAVQEVTRHHEGIDEQIKKAVKR